MSQDVTLVLIEDEQDFIKTITGGTAVPWNPNYVFAPFASEDSLEVMGLVGMISFTLSNIVGDFISTGEVSSQMVEAMGAIIMDVNRITSHMVTAGLANGSIEVEDDDEPTQTESGYE